MNHTLVWLFAFSFLQGSINCYKNDFIFFSCYLAAPRQTLGHCRGGSLTNPILITAFNSWFDPKVTRSLVMRLGHKARPSGVWASAHPILSVTPKPTRLHKGKKMIFFWHLSRKKMSRIQFFFEVRTNFSTFYTQYELGMLSPAGKEILRRFGTPYRSDYVPCAFETFCIGCWRTFCHLQTYYLDKTNSVFFITFWFFSYSIFCSDAFL